GGPNDTSVGEISVKTGNNARNGGKNSLNRLIRCVCGKKIGPDPRNFNQRVSLGRNDLLIRTFPSSFRSPLGPPFDFLFDTCCCHTARCFNKSKEVLITGSKLKAFRNPQPGWGAVHKKAPPQTGGAIR
ncbi:hypothetical protein ACFH0J_19755, partial [Escherichia coli]